MANAPPTGFERATLEIEGEGPPIECLFNPTEYSISKTNIWKVEPVTGAALPPPQFTGGLPRELTLELALRHLRQRRQGRARRSPTGCSR